MFTAIPYLLSTAKYLQQQKSTWSFFADQGHKEEQLLEYKTDLLTRTYQFDQHSDKGLYEKLNFACEKLGIHIPIALYQAENTQEPNASILYLGTEAHIVFSGNILQILTDDELLAIIGHELSHIHLFMLMDGEMEITDRIISALASHSASTPAQYETARLFKLYCEIYCDRGATIVSGTYTPIISALVKISTGLSTINVESYIKQAKSIFELKDGIKSSGVSHPENFIRARSLYLWHTKAVNHENIIQEMVEGQPHLDELDIFQQQLVSNITYKIIQKILEPSWMKTPPILALTKQYFGHFEANDISDITSISEKIKTIHVTVQEYLSYVLYDMATADKTLEDIPLGYCFYLAEQLQLTDIFHATVKKERKITDKKTKALKQQSLSEFQRLNFQTA